MKKILVIDDNFVLLEGIKRFLEFNSYHVTAFNESIEAFQYLQKNTPDLIITDIIMPDKDGIEIIMKAKEQNKNIKIIAMSGGGKITPQDHLKYVMQLGVNTTLIKPFSNDELLIKVQSLIN